jgi:hypothetical protein
MSGYSDDPVGSRLGNSRHDGTSDERPYQSARARGLAGCRTVDTDDGQWRVYELESGPYDRRSGCSLIFESDGVLRRVRDYPTNWRELSDTELMVVSWRR